MRRAYRRAVWIVEFTLEFCFTLAIETAIDGWHGLRYRVAMRQWRRAIARNRREQITAIARMGGIH